MRSLPHIFLSIGPFLMCGLALSTYASENRKAEVLFKRGALHLGAKSLQEFEQHVDPSCSAPKKKKRLAALLTYMKKEKLTQLGADQPVYILAVTTAFSSGASSDPQASFALIRDACINLVSFTPRASGHYIITQEQINGTCEISVIDGSTGTSPLDLKTEAPQSCAAQLR